MHSNKYTNEERAQARSELTEMEKELLRRDVVLQSLQLLASVNRTPDVQMENGVVSCTFKPLNRQHQETAKITSEMLVYIRESLADRLGVEGQEIQIVQNKPTLLGRLTGDAPSPDAVTLTTSAACEPQWQKLEENYVRAKEIKSLLSEQLGVNTYIDIAKGSAVLCTHGKMTRDEAIALQTKLDPANTGVAFRQGAEGVYKVGVAIADDNSAALLRQNIAAAASPKQVVIMDETAEAIPPEEEARRVQNMQVKRSASELLGVFGIQGAAVIAAETGSITLIADMLTGPQIERLKKEIPPVFGKENYTTVGVKPVAGWEEQGLSEITIFARETNQREGGQFGGGLSQAMMLELMSQHRSRQ